MSLLFAVPFAIGAAVVNSNDDKSPWTAILWLAALAGFLLGAGIAAWVQTTGYPIVHGMFCAAGTYAATQFALTAIRIIRGQSVSWLAIFFTFSMVMCAGLLGGALGGAMRKRGLVPGAMAAARRGGGQ